MRASVPFVLGLSLVLLPRLAAAEDVTGVTRLPLEAKDIPADRSAWYGLYMMGGGKSGWLEDRLFREGVGPAASFVAAQTSHLELKSMGQDVRLEATERLEFDATPPFALRVAYMKVVQPLGVQTTTIRRAPDGYRAVVEEGGTTRELVAPVGDFTLADHLTRERWFRDSPAPGKSLSVRAFDLSKLQADVWTTEVFAAQTAVVDGISARYFEARVRSELNGDYGTWRFDADGIMISMKLGGLAEARREPEAVAKTLEAGGDLFLSGVARVEGRIAPDFESVRRVTDLVVEVSGEGAGVLKGGPRQEVVKDEATGATLLRLGAAYGTADKATAAEIEEALAETPAYPTKDPRIVALAKTAVGDATEPAEKVARLVAFVQGFLEDKLCPRLVPVVSLLDQKAGDCSEHAALFTTLARAAGVPAGEVSGLMYMGDAEDKGGGFGGHAWNEVVLDGHWVPVDPTHGETELDATHVTLSRGGRMMDSVATFGRLSFKVRSVKPPPGPPKPKEGPKPSETPESAPVPR